MRSVCIFSGSSHPHLVEAICDRLGQKPSKVDLKKFSNGETSVEIKTSVRDQDVFIVQSGSGEINDNIMEMLIMINACKGGSARSVTAVMPYFPYSRQSKKKAHRGAIAARMIANLMNVAGVNHVITIDLHATQMQGFFKCPIDNLTAEPLLTRWIRLNVNDWENSVVVSKNPGGTKRVTSLADRLGLSFGIVTTDQRKPKMPASMLNSVMLESLGLDGSSDLSHDHEDKGSRRVSHDAHAPREHDWARRQLGHRANGEHRSQHRAVTSNPRHANGDMAPSPLGRATGPDQTNGAHDGPAEAPPEPGVSRAHTIPSIASARFADEDGYEEPEGDDDTDERARDVITGRLIHGHIVDDDVPSPSASQYSTQRGQRRSSDEDEATPDHMMQSFTSVASSRWASGHHGTGLGGTGDATHSDEEEEENLQNPEIETHVTLVGNVRDKAVIIVDDMIDKAGSWIAAAETVVKRGGATKVYCMATHGLFGGDALLQLDECDEIEAVIVTNAFPIPDAKRKGTRKLIVLDVSNLLSEAIRRNHHGESISSLYYLMD
ncbi:ribose-phosphate pyrophosphokinase like protein [Zymoseptoria brevis]|uniref:Ribose-phosphate pyrophosphokinase 1 n=1 Tax=Zymoseptoria brevis TaxID=1047168 RepID=A0A0F4GCI8_9PEZI|nr:ribose-phosphate pyrophosphokinase like protein [Zymoseptoria brevis]